MSLQWSERTDRPARLPHVPRSVRRVMATLFAALALAALFADGAPAQVTHEVNLTPGSSGWTGTALVRSHRDAVVEVGLWESREEPEVKLVEPATATLWPDSFRLEAGEQQTVRVRVPRDAYPEGHLLRLRTVIAPAEEDSAREPDEVRTRIRTVLRMVTKVWVGSEASR